MGYPTSDIATEFPIYIGSSKRYLDVAIFPRGHSHTQTNIVGIIECKRADIRNDSNGVQQLHSYMAACANAKYGAIASYRWTVFEKVTTSKRYTFLTIDGFPNRLGNLTKVSYKPIGNVNYSTIKQPTQGTTNGNNLQQVITFSSVVGIALGVLLSLIISPPKTSSEVHPPAASPITVEIQSTEPSLFTLTVESAIAATETRPLPSESRPGTRVITEEHILPAEQTPRIPATSTPTPSNIPELTPTPSQLFGEIISTQNVSIRLRANPNSPIRGILRPGSIVEILDAVSNPYWILVRSGDGVEGWLSVDYVSISDE